MNLRVNSAPMAVHPAQMQVEILDLDDAESTTRTADGTLNRDRVAVKRQVEMTFSALTMAQISALLKQMNAVFFDFTFPDPLAGSYITRTMYVGNRPASIPFERDGETYWDGLKITLTEK